VVSFSHVFLPKPFAFSSHTYVPQFLSWGSIKFLIANA
jgi:hypothetical protein